jgi:serine/threonine protein kinase/Tfp pilus assembly protein PilF
MAGTLSGRIWDEAASAGAARLAQRFEADWQAAPPGRRPDPLSYLADEASRLPGACLALLRAEMGLRWEAGDPVPTEAYRRRYPDLGDDTLVALAYEEFCLAEDAGRSPDPAAFYARFPELAERLRPVLEIHDLVGSGGSFTGSTATVPATWGGAGAHPAPPAFPVAGQTIGGFRLTAEIGRGSFARVFRAEERQLADRPVALKVSRTGSREPQTLARLQHTHIVPVYSYRTDPATGLHLLCMPYLGGVTLAQVLADPEAKEVRTGAELLAVLDRLGPEGEAGAERRSVARAALAEVSYARAIAWWGARLAEALHHAHERGVLHRDVKPSNVLVTADGLPMLLDFNLAWEAQLDDPEGAGNALGGTLAYMAPEHLEALAEGYAGHLDGRADLYALGVVLHEAMGERPFEAPPKGRTVAETLLGAAARRRAGAPSLRERFPEVPAEFEAVVRRCLAPEPDDRYRNALELARDLQAVADDAPLRHAREPLANRALRWGRRHRLPLSVSVPLALVAALLLAGTLQSARERERLTNQARQHLIAGSEFVREDQLDRADAQFELALRLMERGAGAAPAPEVVPAGKLAGDLDSLRGVAREQLALTQQTRQARAAADALAREAEWLRWRLLGLDPDPRDPSPDVVRMLRPFFVLESPDWRDRAEVSLLDPQRRARLVADVEDVLFLWAVACDGLLDAAPAAARAELAARGRAACAVLRRTGAAGPVEGLDRRLAARGAGRPAPREDGPAPAAPAPAPAGDAAAAACSRRGILHARRGETSAAIAWLDRAARAKPQDFWAQYLLAQQYGLRARESPEAVEPALAHMSMAIALRPEEPRTRFERAAIHRDRGAWARSAEDLRVALDGATGTDALRVRVNLGLAYQALGRDAEAGEQYDRVIAEGPPGDPLIRAARVNRARLLADAGDVARAGALYDALLAADPDDAEARLGRAQLAMRQGRLAAADADLGALLDRRPDEAALWAQRALVRLAARRLAEADADAAEALRLDPTPARRRLRTRIALARGHIADLRPADLDLAELRRLPAGGQPLEADLRAVVADLRADADRGAADACLVTGLFLAALGDHRAAATAAGRGVAAAPHSVRALLVRARVRQAGGDRPGALRDLERALMLEPGEPRVLWLRGLLRREAGELSAARDDLEDAARQVTSASLQCDLAETLLALGEGRRAVEAFSRGIELDPEDPEVHLGRGGALLKLRQPDLAIVDLERAVEWSGDRTDLLLRITGAYSGCLQSRPDRTSRVLQIAWRAVGSAVRGDEAP